MLKKEDILSKFTSSTKTYESKVFEGEQIKVKKLSISERVVVDGVMLKNAKFEGSKVTKIPPSDYNKAAYIATAYGMVEPKMTLEEIESLDNNALPFAIEVFEQIQELDKPKN
ncbi:hypothetical protein [Arcobacter roscoffensis]|uniref:Phage tail assembly protein n=1 Tax=Arcobacter roscoffensis TaxID=2961520 RepID=A0ABY5DZL3_9BACT|nr:hypothetical protein [Arcobacter roscoffensis]UTJ05389.1 hypothetical protein NJU99_08920 [Arcobacter roscoffensis]